MASESRDVDQSLRMLDRFAKKVDEIRAAAEIFSAVLIA
jgi:hypothetical protein